MAPGPDHIISLGTVPRSICVHRFFHEADARCWYQVETFFKYRDTSKTAQEHQELYQRDLQTISEHKDVPATLQRRAHYLLQKVDAKFHETFSQLLVKARQRQAEESVRGLFFDVAQCAGRGGSSSSLDKGAISSSRGKDVSSPCAVLKESTSTTVPGMFLWIKHASFAFRQACN